MKAMRVILPSLLAVLMGYSAASMAEDIDIYSGLGSSTNVPNVLIVMDNAANFSSNAAGSTCIIGGVATALSGTVGGIEQCALYNVINGLPVNADGSARINIGMMVYNANNIRDVNNANCGGSSGGCLAQPLIPMNAASRTAFLAWIRSWVTTGGAGNGYIKASGEATAAAMQEAWAYYKGTTGLSGRSYAGIQPTIGCQKNFVIFIGNSYSSSGTPGDAPSSAATALSSAPGVTAAQQVQIINTINTNYTSTLGFACGSGSYTFPSSAHETKGYYADEWARYMYQSDLYATPPAGVQNIVTYTVGILGSACQAEYAATLTNMATYGGGKYFPTTDYNGLVVAILKILNEVQAVNSVFSSSSLPVSVNAQGTYLNQIYMGMFRPDPGALPRWAGNLKQYQFIIDPLTGGLNLGDSVGNLALDSSGTGFLSPNAISFWTCTDPALNSYPSAHLTAAQQTLLTTNNQHCTDPTNGFWANYPSSANAAALGFDLPDGELVERGGAAQQIRHTNQTVNYATSPAAPRKLYTYCPSGASCNTDLTNTANVFATSNASLTAGLFGSSTSVNVSTLTRSSTTATVTTSGNHGFNTGDSITIANASPADYNGTFTITVTNATHFTYPITEYPPLSVSPTGPTNYTATSTTGGTTVNVSTLTRSGNTVTVTTATAHGFLNGTTVVIAGASPTAYNGSFVITSTGANSFTYTVNEQPPTVAGSGTATITYKTTGAGCPCTIVANINAWNAATPGIQRTLGSTTVTVNTNTNMVNSPSWVGKSFAIANVLDSNGASVAAYNVTSTIVSVNGNSFTFTLPTALSPASPASGTITATGVIPKIITSLIRAGSMADGTATATATVTAHGFANGQSISIGGTPGANESAYIGTFTISNVTANTFDYLITTTPAISATGSMTATRSSGFLASDLTSLINWVRGQDNYGDETGPGGGVNIRPSVHGDVLHSRPTVINYGGSTGVVVFYGDNGGIFHAANGNQTALIGSVGPGDELWGFIPNEFFLKLNRLRTNSPQLNLPSTPPGILPAPAKKDYFIDGTTGLYQLIDGNGVTQKAVLYLTMRRGGRFIYALDVTFPASPQLLWKVDNTTANMSELGQTWSQPKVAKIQGYCGGLSCSTNPPTPVLIFGAGYDPNEDNEPPTANASGRGIFVLDALTGALVWSAGPNAPTLSCTTTQCQNQVSGMNYGIPADITLVDRDIDGFIDRLYAADVGGNIWRVDLEPSGNTTPDNWRVYQLAALGCWSGACSIPTSTSQRKFFYPPEVITTTTYDAVIAGPGDREHPLYVDTATQRYNRVVLLKDTYTGNNATGMTPITYAGTKPLFDATSTPWDGTLNGYYITLAAGEKVVNAPLVTAGYVYFGTNQPTAPSANSCTSTLGIAKGYRLQPFTGVVGSVVFSGGGLPPSPVSGVVGINITTNGVASTKLVPFLIGGGNPDCVGSDCSSALGGQKPPISVPTSRSRTYWYQEMD